MNLLKLFMLFGFFFKFFITTSICISKDFLKNWGKHWSKPHLNRTGQILYESYLWSTSSCTKKKAQIHFGIWFHIYGHFQGRFISLTLGTIYFKQKPGSDLCSQIQILGAVEATVPMVCLWLCSWGLGKMWMPDWKSSWVRCITV